MAGNEKSGAGIAFRMSEDNLKKSIDDFRKEYSDGSRGMVTWELFCSYLGYSVDQVRECYLRGKTEKKNAYNGRAELLGTFYTEVLALMMQTCGKHQMLAKERAKINHLQPEGDDTGANEVRWLITSSDDRCMEIMK